MLDHSYLFDVHRFLVNRCVTHNAVRRCSIFYLEDVKAFQADVAEYIIARKHYWLADPIIANEAAELS